MCICGQESLMASPRPIQLLDESWCLWSKWCLLLWKSSNFKSLNVSLSMCAVRPCTGPFKSKHHVNASVWVKTIVAQKSMHTFLNNGKNQTNFGSTILFAIYRGFKVRYRSYVRELTELRTIGNVEGICIFEMNYVVLAENSSTHSKFLEDMIKQLEEVMS